RALRNAVQDKLEEILKDRGNRRPAQQMLEGGLSFDVPGHEITVELKPNFEHAHHMRTADFNLMSLRSGVRSQMSPPGANNIELYHVAVESEKENIAKTETSGSSSVGAKLGAAYKTSLTPNPLAAD